MGFGGSSEKDSSEEDLSEADFTEAEFTKADLGLGLKVSAQIL